MVALLLLLFAANSTFIGDFCKNHRVATGIFAVATVAPFGLIHYGVKEEHLPNFSLGFLKKKNMLTEIAAVPLSHLQLLKDAPIVAVPFWLAVF